MLSFKLSRTVAVSLLCLLSLLFHGVLAASDITKNAVGPAGGALTGTYPDPVLVNVTTQGAIIFQGVTAGVPQTDASNLFWDNVNKRFGVGTAVPTGTADIINWTPVTGATLVQIGYDGVRTSPTTTLLYVRAGVAQGVNPILTVTDNLGANIFRVLPSGFVSSTGLASNYDNVAAVWGLRNADGLDLSVSRGIRWSATANYSTAKDLGIFRNLAGVLEINNGTPGTITGDLAYERWIGTPVAFAALGVPADGQMVPCSDCTIANPCAGGGTGAFAKRLNGIWVCN